MRIDILTLFPGAFESVLQSSLLGKALERGLLNVNISDIRKFTTDKHKTADDSPYGGGVGMVLKAEPVMQALENLKNKNSKVIVLTPRGKKLTGRMARKLAQEKHLILVCGHYEEIDDRFYQESKAEEISIGDYVLSGGEIPALVLIDTVARFIKGVVGKEKSVEGDSFENALLDFPHYTRPADFRGRGVPPTLMNGNHSQIDKFRRKESLRLTFFRRPDLLGEANLGKDDRALLQEILLD
ncbi:MAG: tRNA (guanosine(37)-N1)-methyltransferase TrmD [Candidatus Margulisbacteria bacterium]|nr:tRNA (guanosine(37)-N1)-methyltransferase TrmD [Candidatus Margulisiibacteriota bacterium]MBU1021751.1 tRNA (guanosine(37)-N1)-methyltransferase TrmD [Candidatus Margulisiibacteriota bacterium]MBU1729497.1 tRNA (guanosine(37)-N1)-methyltransferase TrmD [Candidatus Margulisiibacteriota bacterium]MBU1955402.1 tRNA (guanosine(37)-N1)-methyltransferase TrmD [Candidatus Margulisiibacteriota bacterium]